MLRRQWFIITIQLFTIVQRPVFTIMRLLFLMVTGIAGISLAITVIAGAVAGIMVIAVIAITADIVN